MVKKKYYIKKFRSFIYKVISNYESTKIEKRGRPNKYKLWYYIKYIVKVLCYGYTWDNLDCNCDTSTIRKKFYVWRDNGIFDMAHKLLYDYYIDNFYKS